MQTTPKPTTMVPPSRQGKKAISGHFDKDVHRQLKVLALEKDTSIQNLLSQALNALFVAEQYAADSVKPISGGYDDFKRGLEDIRKNESDARAELGGTQAAHARLRG